MGAEMRLETLAVHAGHHIDAGTRAVVPPIHLSTTFERETDGSYPQRYIYSRSNNPNREALEQCLAALEGGATAVAFSSGSAATMSIFQALAPGAHVIAPHDVYYGTARLLREVFGPWGLETTFVDMTSLEHVQAAVRPQTKLIWVETPSNPLLKVTDIAGVVGIAHAAGAVCVCDNTWATPVLQRPLDLGADLSMQATTKYLGGHGDVLGGVVVSRVDDAYVRRIRQLQIDTGVVPSPFECWLTLRGIRTLPYRMRGHAENALKVAHFLRHHPNVETVHYPGLEEHPGHAIAARQMTLFGGMLSVQVRGGQDEAFAVAAHVQLFTRATSLGAPESLIEHRASIEGPETRTPVNLLRLSIGLEHAEDLIADLAQALAHAG